MRESDPDFDACANARARATDLDQTFCHDVPDFPRDHGHGDPPTVDNSDCPDLEEGHKDNNSDSTPVTPPTRRICTMCFWFVDYLGILMDQAVDKMLLVWVPRSRHTMFPSLLGALNYFVLICFTLAFLYFLDEPNVKVPIVLSLCGTILFYIGAKVHEIVKDKVGDL